MKIFLIFLSQKKKKKKKTLTLTFDPETPKNYTPLPNAKDLT